MPALLRTVPLALLCAAAKAQAFSAQLSANAPLEVSFNGVASAPAGPLLTGGLLQQTMTFGPVLTAELLWMVPGPGDLACSVRSSFDTGSLSGSFIPATFQADTTLEVSGPAGRWGTVEIVVTNYLSAWPTVDVGDDGTNDAALGNFYGSVGTSPTSLTRSWSVPAQIGAAPLPIRIVFPTGSNYSPEYLRVDVRFVPWTPNAVDLGSGCADNHTGWVIGEYEDQDYGLSVLPGTGGAAATLHARGHGAAQLFVVAPQDARLPLGTLPFGNGCDDLLLNASGSAPGVPRPFVENEWTLDVPPLPPGLIFHLQHVSFDVAGGWIYFGATNVARYQT